MFLSFTYVCDAFYQRGGLPLTITEEAVCRCGCSDFSFLGFLFFLFGWRGVARATLFVKGVWARRLDLDKVVLLFVARWWLWCGCWGKE